MDLAEELLEAGADIEHQTYSYGLSESHTALTLAVQNGHVELVHALLKAGANTEYQFEPNYTALTLVITMKLLEASAQTEQRTNGNHTALTLALKNRHVRCEQVLVQAGAKIKHSTDEGHAALMLAVYNRHMEFEKFLLQREANTEQKTIEGDTAQPWPLIMIQIALMFALSNYYYMPVPTLSTKQMETILR